MERISLSEKHKPNCDYEIKEQDRYLPIANVTRVMKKALPEKAKLSKEAKECVQECVSEYISFVTSQAIDRCTLEKRKTLNGEDILWSMFTLGFEHYAETLRIYLAKYRELEQEEQSARVPRRRKPQAQEEIESGSEEDMDGFTADEFIFDSLNGGFAAFDGLALQPEIREKDGMGLYAAVISSNIIPRTSREFFCDKLETPTAIFLRRNADLSCLYFNTIFKTGQLGLAVCDLEMHTCSASAKFFLSAYMEFKGIKDIRKVVSPETYIQNYPNDYTFRQVSIINIL